MTILRSCGMLLAALVAACGSSGGASGGSSGGTGPGGPSVVPSTCSGAPDCGGCPTCVDFCICEGSDLAACNAVCTGQPMGVGGVGGSGATGAGGASGNAGGPPMGGSGGLTPTPVTEHFDWPETPPPAGPCRAGVYEGTFTCDVPAGLFGAPVPVTGPVTFTLQQSANGEILEIVDGKLDGTAMQFAVQFTADLIGQLDCQTDVFHADAVNGSYGAPPLVAGTFSGFLDAQLNRGTQTLEGMWSLTPDQFPSPCVGPWNAVWRRP